MKQALFGVPAYYWGYYMFIASEPSVTFGVAGNVVHHQVCTMVALHRSILEMPEL
jgi:hypothetical protein